MKFFIRCLSVLLLITFSFSFISAQVNINTSLMGRWAYGSCECVCFNDNYAYLGRGGYLQIVDFADPGSDDPGGGGNVG